jgi:hypothetical protein
MSVGRNDPCPCGSGKKYKKCCLKKENVIQLGEHQLEQFYRGKQGLVEKLDEFLVENVSFEEYHQLQSAFNQRTKGTLVEETEEGFFKFWLFFFYRFSNHLRLIDWFDQVEGDRLPQKAKTMLQDWLQLKPKILQAVDRTESAVIFEDQLTKERFPVASDQENMNHFFPWVSTIAMVEPFNDLYYFNGVRVTVGPDALENVVTKVTEWMDEKQCHADQILTAYYPELLVALTGDDLHLHSEGQKVVETTLTYEIMDPYAVLDYVRKQPDFRIEDWQQDKKELVWAGNSRAYMDSECDQPVKLADVYGKIMIANAAVTITCWDEEHVRQIKQRLGNLHKAFQFQKVEQNELGHMAAHMQTTMVHLEQETPKYFALYAQQNPLEEMEHPIPKYDHLSIRALVEKGRTKEAETWLRQSEYNVYRLVLEQEETVEVTADFNTVRKSLGLPLSPFVTGGGARETEFRPIELAAEVVLLEDDIPYLEDLGFTPGNVNFFYVHPLIQFYREKTVGRTEATIEKYRKSLFALRALLQGKSLDDWQVDDLAFWETLLTEDYFKLDFSKTARQDFFSVVRLFFTWIERVQGVQYDQVIALVQQLDQQEKE